MTKRSTVFIVDDMRSNREMLKSMFQEKYDILEAADGETALEILYANVDKISVILLDKVMPKMDGFEVLERINKSGILARIPVVMITADSSLENKKRGVELGASDVIGKDYDPYIVRRRIKNIIELYEHKNHLELLVERQTVELKLQTEKITKMSHQVIDALGAVIEYRSIESGQHIKRIRVFTKALLYQLQTMDNSMNLSEEKIDMISDASAVHDIGKIAIPDSILLKPGKLTAEEYEIMKTHSAKGCEIIQNFGKIEDEEYLSFYYDICRFHHERYDGKGYPDGLVGDEIPVVAQVVSVADVYDALVNKRVYKQAYTHEEAVKMIVGGECGAFSPEIMECFVKSIGKFKALAELYSDKT